MAERPHYYDDLKALRHVVSVAAQLDEDMAEELCDRITRVVEAFDGAKTLENWLAAVQSEEDLDEWAFIVNTRAGYVGVVLEAHNPHMEMAFPSIDGDASSVHRQRGQVTSLVGRRWSRAVDRHFTGGGSEEAKVELEAAEEAMAVPPSLFHQPIQAARTVAHARLELHREDRQREFRTLIEESDGEGET